MNNRETEAWHYPKNKDGTRTGTTICVLVRDERIFIGEARLGGVDQFNRKTGMAISKGRAERSYERYLAKKGKQ